MSDSQESSTIDSCVAELLKEEIPVYEEVNRDTFLGILFDGYKIIDDIQSHVTDSYHGLNDFLHLLKELQQSARFTEDSEELIFEINIIVEEAEMIIRTLQNNQTNNDRVMNILEGLLDRIEDVLDIHKKEEKKIEKKPYEEFLKLDGLYSKLYEALLVDDIRKATLYRGRIIRELKRKQKLIGVRYQNVKGLEEIRELLDSNRPFDEIQECLKRFTTEDYYEELRCATVDLGTFQKTFHRLYQDKQVHKVLLYKDALASEVRDQKRDLRKRYSSEFLGKSDVRHILPNAVGLSVKELANTVDEYKLAQAGREKAAKAREVAQAAGKVAATPMVYAGKFLVGNWYTLYKHQKHKSEEVPKVKEEKPTTPPVQKVDYEQVEKDRSLAIQMFKNTHPGMIEEEATRIIDEAARKTSYHNLAVAYKKEWEKKMAERTTQVAQERRNTITVYQELHPELSFEEVSRFVDAMTGRVGYEEQTKMYQEELKRQQTLAMLAELKGNPYYDFETFLKAYEAVFGEGTGEEFEDIYGGSYKQIDYDDGTQFVVKPFEKSIWFADGSVYAEVETESGIERTISYPEEYGPVTQVVDEHGELVYTLESPEEMEVEHHPEEWVWYLREFDGISHEPIYLPVWMADCFDRIMNQYGISKQK